MRNEHLRPLLDNAEDCTKFFEISRLSHRRNFSKKLSPELLLATSSGGWWQNSCEAVHDEVRGCHQALPIRTLDPSRVREHCTRCAGDDRPGPKLHSALHRWCWSFRFGVQEGHDDSSAQHGSGREAHSISPTVFRTEDE